MRVLAAILALLFSGCGWGFGSAYVGQWREREEVDFVVCVEDDGGGCRGREEVNIHHPPRSFWGVYLTYPAIGGAWGRARGEDVGGFRLQASLEVLRGKGRYAAGLRATGITEFFPAVTTSVPLSLVGHAALSERTSAYAGLGWSPVTRLVDERRELDARSRGVMRALGGIQLVLSRSYGEGHLLATLEVDHMRAMFGALDYQSYGLTGHIAYSF